MNITTTPNINDANGCGFGFNPMNQKPNDQPVYKLVKKIKGSDHVEVISKAFASMPPKLESLRLKEEFTNLIKIGCLNAALEEVAGSDFRLTFVKDGQKVEIYYELIMETNYSSVSYDPMI